MMKMKNSKENHMIKKTFEKIQKKTNNFTATLSLLSYIDKKKIYELFFKKMIENAYANERSLKQKHINTTHVFIYL